MTIKLESVSMFSFNFPRYLLSIFLLIIISWIVLFLAIIKPLPLIDSATFIYVAGVLLTGGIPYRDVFDHKAPLVYFLDAIGLLISNKDIWGVWILEYVNISIAVFFSYLVVEKLFGQKIAIVSVLAWVSILPRLLDGGNLTEEYALSLQFLTMYILLVNKNQKLSGFFFGILGGLLFNLKPNLLGAPLVAVIVLIWKEVQSKNLLGFLRMVKTFSLGFLLVLLPIVLFFYINNAFFEYLDYSYRFNRYYSGIPFFNLANVIYRGLQLVIFTPIGLISLVGYFDLFVIMLYSLKCKAAEKLGIFVLFVIILLPVEFLLVSVSGKIYNHYYMAWLPVFSLLFAYGVYRFVNLPTTENFKLSLFVVFLVVVSFLGYQIFRQYTLMQSYDFKEHPIVTYIRNNSIKEDDLLFWGFGSPIYLALKMKSPTRYVYQSPLYIEGFQRSEMYEELLNDIKNKKPRLIVDGVEEDERFPAINCEKGYIPKPKKDFYPLDDIHKIFEYICANYTKSEPVKGWRVYTIHE